MNPKKQQLPKARVMWANHYEEGYLVRASKAGCDMDDMYRPTDRKGISVAVIPAATAKQAKAIAAFFNLSEEEQVEAVAKVMCPHSWPQNKEYWLHDARAVLRRVKEGK